MKARCGQVVRPEAGVRGRIRRLAARAQAVSSHDCQVVTRVLGQAGQRGGDMARRPPPGWPAS